MRGFTNGDDDNSGSKFWTWAFRTLLIMLIGILIVDRDNEVRDLRAEVKDLAERVLKVEIMIITDDR